MPLPKYLAIYTVRLILVAYYEARNVVFVFGFKTFFVHFNHSGSPCRMLSLLLALVPSVGVGFDFRQG